MTAITPLEDSSDEARAAQMVNEGSAVDIATARLIVSASRRIEEQKANDGSRRERSDDT
jgi:hypothetical protein